MKPARQVEPFLEKLFHQYHRAEYLHSDPLRIPHKYNQKNDQELVALIAALFAYGSASQLMPAVEAILKPLGPRPADFVLNYKPAKLWSGVYYRFHKEEHFEFLILMLHKILKEYGSLEAFFGEGTVEQCLNKAADKTYKIMGSLQIPVHLKRGMRFLWNQPSAGSACKRLLMYFRWMVRKDDLDFGLWNSLKPKDLVIPLDTHVARLSYYLRLRDSKENKAPGWKMAVEVTQALAEIDPEDPVRYDFALSRLGILNLCKKHYEKSICTQCAVEPACRYSQIRLEKKK